MLVAGSSGSYFQIADQIVQMDRYVPKGNYGTCKESSCRLSGVEVPGRKAGKSHPGDRKVRRNPGIDRKAGVKLKTMGRDAVMIGHETIDLRYVEQLVDIEQLNTLGQIVRFLEEEIFDGKRTLGQAVEQAEKLLDKRGPAGMCEGNDLYRAILGKTAYTGEFMPVLNRYGDAPKASTGRKSEKTEKEE